MKPISFLCAVALICYGGLYAADASNQAKQGEASAPALDRVSVERDAIDEAKALVRGATANEAEKAAKVSAVEELVAPLNQAKKNSPEWRLETAQRLMHVAEQIAREGKPDNVSALAQRALQHLKIADTPANDAEIRAAAKTLSAWINERYLADEDAAIADYEGAAALAGPGNAKAKEAAQRLKKAKENARERTAKSGK